MKLKPTRLPMSHDFSALINARHALESCIAENLRSVSDDPKILARFHQVYCPYIPLKDLKKRLSNATSLEPDAWGRRVWPKRPKKDVNHPILETGCDGEPYATFSFGNSSITLNAAAWSDASYAYIEELTRLEKEALQRERRSSYPM
jgi:hypothetical protein